MYLLIAATVVIFGLAATITVPGNAGSSGAMPRSRRVQPHTRDVHHLVAQEAERARDRVHQQLARLGY